MPPTEERYRCIECGHGHQLYAIAYGYMEGPLGTDGELTRYDVAEDTELQEDTIACREHGDVVTIEKRMDGRWCRWERCEACDGSGRSYDYCFGSKRDIGYCRGRGFGENKLRSCGGSGGSWAPVEEKELADA